MNRPTWNNFIGKNFDDNHYAMEALARLLFRTRYGIGDSLPYFKNHSGNETEPINANGEIVGFQSKYFDDGKIDADNILHSLETACEKYPSQNRYIIYTNSAFGNPHKGKDKPAGLERLEQKAKDNNITLEWIFGENVLDLVQTNELAYNVFFNPQSHLCHIQDHIDEHNNIELKSINTDFRINDKPISFDRTRYIAKISDCISNNKNILISGESGSGKSAIVKNYCEQIKDKLDYALFILNAASLNVDTVNDIFNLHEAYTLADFSSYFDGFTKKIIVIDSAEKILEINNSSPARLFVEHLKNKGWIFIFTCKENSVSDITDRLISEYELGFESVNVAPEEVSYIIDFAKEHNITIPRDSKLLNEIRIPFYFARYSELSKCTDINAEGFRDKIWKQKVLGSGNRANQIKREECLLEIIETSQNSGTFIVPYKSTDIEIASLLVDADILGEYPHKGFFVKHDIYTDWAIDIIIQKKFEIEDDLLKILSEDSSIQYINAFKRFLLNDLNNTQQYKSITNLLFIDIISSRWTKAIYECIGRSNNYAGEWIKRNQERLKENSYQHFNEFIDTLVVTCQYVDQYFTFEGKDYPLMKPTGSGWEAAVDFIWSNIGDYYQGNLQSVQKLLSNFSGFKKANPLVMHRAGLLSLRIFDIIAKSREDGEVYWFENGGGKWAELVCIYALSIKDEIRERFNLITKNKWTSHKDPYVELIEYILKKADSLTLLPICLVCNNEILQLLSLFWIENKASEDTFGSYYSRSSDFSFGLSRYFEGANAYFPCSAYQTPVYTLLEAENMMTSKYNNVIKFLVEFIDGRVEVFKSRGFANAIIDSIDVRLRDGKMHKVIISDCLWNLYRGTSGLAMPDLMESIHMALERYLLELADKKENTKIVDEILWYILENSHSCSLYGIVASVSMAHPNDFIEQLLFLMQDVKFLMLDLMRHTREFHAGSMDFAYYRHKDLLKERRESNALKHRNEHLEQMLLKLQVIFDKYNEPLLLDRVYGIVDALKMQVSKMNDDEKTLAKYVILRIDARAMQQNEVVSADGSRNIEYSTVITPEMQTEQNRMEKNNEEMLKGICLRQWIDYRFKHNFEGSSKYKYDNNVNLVLDIIRDIRKQIEVKEGGLSLLIGDQYLPFMASAILLSQFIDKLNPNEKTECKHYLNEALSQPKFLLDTSLSGLEICLNAIPCLLDEDDDKAKETTANYLVTYSLLNKVNYSKRPCDIIYSVIKKTQMWQYHPDFMVYVLEVFLKTIQVENYININHKQAESLLCLLTPDSFKRDLAILAIDKMAEFWKPKDPYHHSDSVGNFESANLIADYWMNASTSEIKSMVRLFKPYINGDLNHDNLISSVVLNCAQYNKYENFWIVWDELYDGMINNTRLYYNSSTLNSFLINPDYLVENPGDWFRIEQKDVARYMRVANDMAVHPSVIYSTSKVFATIGKKFQIDILPVFNAIVKEDIQNFKDGLKLATINYLEQITSNVFPIFLERRKENPELNDYMVNILYFMQKHESKTATLLLSQI